MLNTGTSFPLRAAECFKLYLRTGQRGRRIRPFSMYWPLILLAGPPTGPRVTYSIPACVKFLSLSSATLPLLENIGSEHGYELVKICFGELGQCLPRVLNLFKCMNEASWTWRGQDNGPEAFYIAYCNHPVAILESNFHLSSPLWELKLFQQSKQYGIEVNKKDVHNETRSLQKRSKYSGM